MISSTDYKMRFKKFQIIVSMFVQKTVAAFFMLAILLALLSYVFYCSCLFVQFFFIKVDNFIRLNLKNLVNNVFFYNFIQSTIT